MHCITTIESFFIPICILESISLSLSHGFGYQRILWQGGMSDKWLRRLSHDTDFACAIHGIFRLIGLPLSGQAD